MTVVCCGAKRDGEGLTERFKWYTVRETRNEEIYYSLEQESKFSAFLEREKPDMIHIWGSEYPHTLAMVKAAERIGVLDNTVISIQGLVSMIALYYTAELPPNVIKNKTLYELLRGAGIEDMIKAFYTRGRYEIEAFSLAKNCIGRTDWDYNCLKAINHHIHYYKCNETLRECFYSGEWKYDQCDKYSIFVSQATYPIKGLHSLLQAFPMVLEKYPNAQIRIAGANIVSREKIIDKIKASSYGGYLCKLITQQNMQNHIHFLGTLNAQKMKEEYLKANVFVSCSSIENSPNSVGEAMLLGTPVVASDVGGTSSILNAPDEGILYRWNSPSDLATSILDVFQNPGNAVVRAARAKEHAKKTHCSQNNLETLLKTYSKIIQAARENAMLSGENQGANEN